MFFLKVFLMSLGNDIKNVKIVDILINIFKLNF